MAFILHTFGAQVGPSFTILRLLAWRGVSDVVWNNSAACASKFRSREDMSSILETGWISTQILPKGSMSVYSIDVALVANIA